MPAHLLTESRLVVRQLSTRPGAAIATLLTLALGIGATAAMAAVVYAVLLAPHPVRELPRMVIGWGLAPETSHGLVELAYRDIEALGQDSRSLESIAAVGSSTWTAVLDRDGDPVRVPYAGVSGSFFETLGVPAQLGRVLTPSDDRPGATSVVVLSHAAWLRRFGGDPGIVGQTLRLDGDASTVVGIAPAGFDVPSGAEFWAPVVPGLLTASVTWKTDVLSTVGVFFYIGRLRPGVSRATAADELSERGRALDAARGSVQVGSRVATVALADYHIGPTRLVLWGLLGAVGVLALVASANVAGLQLVRAAARQRHDAVRLALGASAAEVTRAWWLEATLLVGAATCLGLAVAPLLVSVIVAAAPADVPRLADARVYGPAWLVALGTALAALAIYGAVPRRVLRTTSIAEVMRDGVRSTAGVQPRRLRQGLVGAQLAFTIVLLVMATLVVRSFDALRQLDLGFVSDDVVAVRVEPQRPPTEVNAWMAQLLDVLSSRDVIADVGAVYLRPLALGPIGQGTTVLLEGQPDTPATTEANPLLNYQVATPGYFRTMRIPVLAGRTFTDADRADTERVVVVGASTATRLWPGQPAVGQRLRTASFDRRPGAPRQAWRRVVGVVADVRYRGLTEVSLDLYDPATQSSTGVTDLVLRTRVDLPTAVSIVREEARRLAPEALVDEVTALDAVVQRARAPWRFGAWIFTLFAVAAAGLAALGLFGLVALDVTERRTEFALRQAIGATSATIARTVVASTAGAVVAGGGVGLVGALAAATAIRGVLVGVPVTDAWTYLVAVVAVAALVAAAALGPARRAMRTSPAELLRHG